MKKYTHKEESIETFPIDDEIAVAVSNHGIALENDARQAFIKVQNINHSVIRSAKNTDPCEMSIAEFLERTKFNPPI
jgi:hypothetical protein